ncbi:Hypothetical predicted protein [Paramuricea clavata]|uniref:Uncharacterized protein n=1 Tax=Paramuricea clavata TaxID=317549 RepID=A0A6S7KC31_PARCT|nr:Hypothetical predicted protein [Paramuricea clavata]
MAHLVLALFLTLFLLLETQQNDPDVDRKTIQEELDKIKGDKTELRFALAASMIRSKESVIEEWK